MSVSNSGRFNPEFGTMVEKQVGCHRGTVKAPAEGVEETAQRFKALEWTRAAGTAWGCGSVVPDLILGTKELNLHPKRTGYFHSG